MTEYRQIAPREDVINMEYPKFESMTVTIFERHLEWLNRRFLETGVTRSAQVREAVELLIAKDADAPLSEPAQDSGRGAI